MRAEAGGAGFLEGEEIEKHLDVQAHADRREVEGLFAGLVVHHPEVELPVLQPAVHPVHLAPYPQLAVRLGDHHGGEVRFRAVSKGELEGQGDKVGTAELLRRLVNDGVGGRAQAGEEVAEAGVPVLEVAQLLFHIFFDVLADEGMEGVLIHLGKAPQGLYVPGDALQEEVEEGADLGRVKGGGGPGPGLEAVLHEIGEVAGSDALQAGGGHAGAFSVEGPDRPGGEGPPGLLRRPGHGLQPGAEGGHRLQPPPEGPAGDGGLQGREGGRQPVGLGGGLPLHAEGGEQG